MKYEDKERKRARLREKKERGHEIDRMSMRGDVREKETGRDGEFLLFIKRRER